MIVELRLLDFIVIIVMSVAVGFALGVLSAYYYRNHDMDKALFFQKVAMHFISFSYVLSQGYSLLNGQPLDLIWSIIGGISVGGSIGVQGRMLDILEKRYGK